jgi:hypothetical protein
MAMVRTFNEGKVCDAVIRRLEAREGHRRKDLRSPEREGHVAPVELICRIGDRLFAFEHTGIEPFATSNSRLRRKGTSGLLSTCSSADCPQPRTTNSRSP